MIDNEIALKETLKPDRFPTAHSVLTSKFRPKNNMKAGLIDCMEAHIGLAYNHLESAPVTKKLVKRLKELFWYI